MSTNHHAYKDHLKYLPEKERRALEEAFFIDEKVEDAPESMIRQINRSKTVRQKTLKRA